MRRSPHGERGLKFLNDVRSLPYLACRSPHGERGLKSSTAKAERQDKQGRSPRGERGLKLKLVIMNLEVVPSLSSRRAWIEIYHYRVHHR